MRAAVLIPLLLLYTLAYAAVPTPPPTTLANSTLSWAPSLQNTDGSTLTNLMGFRIYRGTSATNLVQMAQLANPAATSYVVSNPSAGTFFYAVTEYTMNGAESAKSAVVSTTIAAPVAWMVLGTGLRPVYELIRNKANVSYVQGYQLGFIKAGKPCEALVIVTAGAFHKVSEAEEEPRNSPTYKGRTGIAQCIVKF